MEYQKVDSAITNLRQSLTYDRTFYSVGNTFKFDIKVSEDSCDAYEYVQ